MQVIHFGHSCVLLDTGRTRLLVDPGNFSTGFEEVTDLDAILVTHQHPDHLDTARLGALVAANPRARLVADEGSVPAVRALGLDPQPAAPGERLRFGATTVDVLGGRHAVIHPEVPVVPNIGYLVDDGAFYHPGDSFFVPEQSVDVLGIPTAAPWQKITEAVTFLRAVAPRLAIPIHEAVLAQPQIYYHWLDTLAPADTSVRIVATGDGIQT